MSLGSIHLAAIVERGPDAFGAMLISQQELWIQFAVVLDRSIYQRIPGAVARNSGQHVLQPDKRSYR